MEEASAAFLNNTIGSELNDVELISTNSLDGTFSLANDIAKERKRNFTCSNITVMAISALLLAVGLGLVALGIVETQQRVESLCSHCVNLTQGLFGAGAAVAAVALLGIASAKTRHRYLVIPFTVLVALACVALLFIAGAALLFRLDIHALDIEGMWHSAVSHDPALICNIQESLQCSGFRDGCCFTNSTPISDVVVPDKLAPILLGFCFINNSTLPSWVAQVCAPSCSSNIYTTPCDNAIDDLVERSYIPVIATSASLALLMLLAAVCSCLILRRRR